MRPIAACAEVVEVSTRVSQVTPESPGIPRAMVYGLFRALPGDRAFLPPSSLRSLLLKNLTPASGRQDHTTSPSASAPFVKSASASTASRPAFVTIASRPSVGRDSEGYRSDLGFRKTRIFLQTGLDRQITDLPVRADPPQPNDASLSKRCRRMSDIAARPDSSVALRKRRERPEADMGRDRKSHGAEFTATLDVLMFGSRKDGNRMPVIGSA
jgi:hypothetical protein